MKSENVKSPCISVCALDEEDICEGCYRSAQEITEWSVMGDEGRRQVLERARRRFEQRSKYRLL